MRYRNFGDRVGSVSAFTVRLEDGRHRGSVNDWRDFVFACLETGVNSFEIGQVSANMLAGCSEAIAAVERRLFIISWRTSLTEGALEVVQKVRDKAASLGLEGIDILTLELERPLRDPGVLADLRQTQVARWLCVAGDNNLLDMSILSGEFDGMTLRLDPNGGWNERNRIKAASNRGMGVIALDVGLEFATPPSETPTPAGLLRLFLRQREPQMSATFRIDVPGWSEQQVAVSHALTDPCISTVVVQPNCIPALEGLAWCVERDLPGGAQAQIEMARFSNTAPEAPPVRRRAKR